MKSLQSLLTAIGVIAIAGAIWYSLFIVVPQLRTDKARHDCAQDYHMEYLDPTTNTTIIKPIDDLYAQCLRQKGI